MGRPSPCSCVGLERLRRRGTGWVLLPGVPAELLCCQPGPPARPWHFGARPATAAGPAAESCKRCGKCYSFKWEFSYLLLKERVTKPKLK